MTLTLLLDLDNTLLHNDMEGVFIQAYFQALAETLAPIIAPEVLLPALLAASSEMMANRDPSHTLRELFALSFFPGTGLTWEQLSPFIDAFYGQRYARLQPLTRSRPDAPKLVSWAFEQGYRVVVATNPLFPQMAQRWRLRWAGVPAESFPYACVTSYETSHFAKPSPWYYTEILARLGWPTGPVLMVGDSPSLDVAPCRQLEIPVFLAETDPPQPPVDGVVGRGTLTDLQSLLAETSWQPWQLPETKPAALQAALAATPAALRTWQQEHQLASLAQAACRLQVLEQTVHLPALQRLESSAAGRPVFVAAAAERTGADCTPEQGQAALQAFAVARRRLLAKLAGFSRADWQKEIKHDTLGTVSVQAWLASVWQRERDLLRQLWAEMATTG